MLSHSCLTTNKLQRALQFKPIINLAHKKCTEQLVECYETRRSVLNC